MLVRLVSNSSPRDLPALASQSTEITGVTYCTQKSNLRVQQKMSFEH